MLAWSQIRANEVTKETTIRSTHPHDPNRLVGHLVVRRYEIIHHSHGQGRTSFPAADRLMGEDHRQAEGEDILRHRPWPSAGMVPLVAVREGSLEDTVGTDPSSWRSKCWDAE